MATILNFRNKEQAASAHDFLTDETEKLSFRTAEDGVVSIGEMSSACLPSPLPDLRKDWRNQELADLFRVRQLLIGAGVPVETMRGITDEGDPWFIYCHFNGDVFIHMARIDGIYVLDSPNVRRPLRGADFNALIADFTNDALPAFKGTGDDSDTKRRVVRLERGGKVRLHPSAMLAALIWTLFLASEELVLLTPEERAVTDDDLLDFSDMIFPAGFEIHTIETESADIAGLTSAETGRDMSLDILHATPEAQIQMRDAATTGQQGLAMHQNAFAMGLSTIAIAMGFMSEAVLLDNQRKVLDGLKALGVDQDVNDGTAIGSNLEQAAGDDGTALLKMLAEFLGFDRSLNADVAEAAPVQNDASPLQELLLPSSELSAEIQAQTALTSSKTVQSVIRDGEDTDLSEAPQKMADTPAQADTLITVKTAKQQQNGILNLEDIVNGQQRMEEFQLGQETVKASFDLTSMGSMFLAEYIAPTQRKTKHSEFSEQAQSFIEYIQSKDTDLGVITLGNEIIMIDRSAFGPNGGDTYSYSWETNDGQIISMIGLRAEFQEFDLIA